ncbi:general stress protein [Agromyces archimandritae]|uniref:General stress protein 17M-like domain-containing protein n=1 Tax=Agromyces archimandritae TaxID=2781962 RepID=A0A975FLF7_9MICO|nr:general stress protein [Agromyces archimandritae]QTX04269.1 hypothetical protein G127AT_13435 [Agromyces archimandritae]
MSNPRPMGGRAARVFPTLPSGEDVATFESYEAAQGAVDRLAKAEFPVKSIAIVGNDLTSVERITGKMSWGRAAGGGALTGVWLGTFMGLLLFIFSPTPAAAGILISAILIGAGFGMVFGLVSYSVNRRRRDFTSTMQVVARSYTILAPSELAARARNVLGTEGTIPRPAASGPAPDASGPAPSGPAPVDAPAAPPPGARTYGEALDEARRAARSGAAATPEPQVPAAAAPETAAEPPASGSGPEGEGPAGDADRGSRD